MLRIVHSRILPIVIKCPTHRVPAMKAPFFAGRSAHHLLVRRPPEKHVSADRARRATLGKMQRKADAARPAAAGPHPGGLQLQSLWRIPTAAVS